jgi:large repetitive protein
VSGRRARCWIAAVVGAFLLAGCATPEVPDELSAAVAEVRQAAEAGELEIAEGLLDQIRQQVQALVEQGDLSEAQAAQIMTAAWDVNRALGLLAQDADDSPGDDVEVQATPPSTAEESVTAESEPEPEPEPPPAPAPAADDPAPDRAPSPTPTPTTPPPLPSPTPSPSPSPSPTERPSETAAEPDDSVETPAGARPVPPGQERRDAAGLGRASR